MQLNYYAILGLKRTATHAEIKAAYKKLAIQYHPDKHQGNTYFEEQFKQVNAAYQILSNPNKRYIYDQKLEYIAQQQRARQYAQTTYAQTRQREPASVRERYYRPIKRKQKFSRRDWQITIGFFASIFLVGILINLIMDNVTAKKRFRNADTFIEQEQWASAHSMLSEAIDFEPKFVDAYQKRGYINLKVYKDYRAALADYNAALEYSSEPTPENYFRRGECYAQLRHYSQAESDFTRTINLNRNYQSAYFKRGEVRLLDLNKWNEAVTDLTTYLKKPQGTAEMNKALLYRGFAYYLLDDYEAAIQDYHTALKTDAKNGRLYYLLGKAEFSKHEQTAACQHFAQAYKLGYEPAIIDWQAACRN